MKQTGNFPMGNRWKGFPLVIVLIIFTACAQRNEKKSITYSRDIHPIIRLHCTPCHRPGAAGPFDLISFDDVKSHAHTVALTVQTRFMPPWPADPSYVHFKEEKYLTDEEISLISDWVDASCPEGEQMDYSLSDTSTGYGRPDLTIRLSEAFKLPGDNLDKFMMMKVPIEIPNDTFVRMIEIVPGNTKLVHHINAHFVQYQDGAKGTLKNGLKAINTELHDKKEAYKLLDLPNDNGSYPMLTPSVANFLPGVEPALYPNGIGGYRLKKNSVLLLDNIHYGPTPIDTTDQTAFNIYFMPKAPVRPTKEMILGTSGITPIEPPLIIAPGNVQTFITRYTLPEDISLLTVNPHMHLLGSSFKAYALTPTQDTIRLLRIGKWDFRWQYFYTYQHPLKLSKGTTIIAEGVYDNTENNPLNPFHPPQQISEREGSMRTTDEMFQLICTYLPYLEGDETIDLEKTY